MATSKLNIPMYDTYKDDVLKLRIARFGKICLLMYNNTSISLASKTWVKVNNAIPSGWKPAETPNITCACGTTRDVICLAHPNMDLSISFYNTSSALQTGVFGCTLLYVCD